MISTTSCSHCGGALEFDVETQSGIEVQCPHCNRITMTPSAAPVTQSRRNVGRWVGLSIAGVVVLVVAVGIIRAVLAIGKDPEGGTMIAGMGGVFLVAAVAAVLLVLAIFWLIFPWMVYVQLRRIGNAGQETNELLRRITTNQL